ncbi:Conserved_hypothetical protein [Hexamita inflata]|uniref:Uncharacterized protein n=1 Tax=Hexamita inflata TaxID=28002 RepID=A0AA86UZQ6_9EUKA|nr:Conserved hypothetical protein [Hexamita inflata]
MEYKQFKITFIGDHNVHKTGFLHQFYKQTNSCYIPVVQENYAGQCRVNNQHVHYVLQDTLCDDDYERIRRFYYDETDVCICDIHVLFHENILTKLQPTTRRLYLIIQSSSYKLFQYLQQY